MNGNNAAERISQELGQINPQMIFQAQIVTALALKTGLLVGMDPLRFYIQAFPTGANFNSKTSILIATSHDLASLNGADFGGHPIMYGMVFAEHGLFVQQEFWWSNPTNADATIMLITQRAQQ